MRILLTNDDGIDSPGLAVLETIARQLASDVWTVAPEDEQSGASRSLSFNTPLRMRQLADQRYAVGGTPVDCVLMAVSHLMKQKPDLILSGVNRGHNIAEDVTYSGTIAGAMEGVMMGAPSIALSQAFGIATRDQPHWATAEQHAPALLRQLIKKGWPDDVLININFPDCPPDAVAGVQITRQGRRDHHPLMDVEKRADPRGQPYYWLRFHRRLSQPEQGSDLHAIYGGHISVTPLHLDLTHDPSRAQLANGLTTGGKTNA